MQYYSSFDSGLGIAPSIYRPIRPGLTGTIWPYSLKGHTKGKNTLLRKKLQIGHLHRSFYVGVFIGSYICFLSFLAPSSRLDEFWDEKGGLA